MKSEIAMFSSRKRNIKSLNSSNSRHINSPDNSMFHIDTEYLKISNKAKKYIDRVNDILDKCGINDS